MDMKKFVLGVDGGGTKTQCAVFDTAGARLDETIWGPTNYELLKDGFSGLKRELQGMLDHILEKNKLSFDDFASCVFGLSGIDTSFQYNEIHRIISETGINDFILSNDAYLGIKAGIPEGYGICAINGTGCAVAGIDPVGGMLQIGGQYELTGDSGGGGYIGACAVRSVYEYLYKDGPYTCMKEHFFEALGIESEPDFLDSIVTSINKGIISVKDYNTIAFKAANQGDRVALDLLQHMGGEYARSINGIISRLDFYDCDSVGIVLAGSIFVKGENPAAIDRLKADVLMKNPDMKITFEILRQPPVMGAVMWALSNISTGRDLLQLFEKVGSQF